MRFIPKFKRPDNWKEFVKKPAVTAVLILLAVLLWVGTGFLTGGEDANGSTAPVTKADEPFTVQVTRIPAKEYVETIQVRGRTQALRTVELKAEEEGQVIRTPVEKGTLVKKGQVICEIASNAREAQLQQAQALAAQRQLEYNAALELATKGFRSETQVASAKAELDAGAALVRQAEVAVGRTKIRAPFDGLVNDRQVEVGNYLQIGGVCAVILTVDPYLVVGEVSDSQVALIQPGTEAKVNLTTGESMTGKVRYISSAARIETRTYRIEVEVANPDGALRDGTTADIKIPSATIRAHFISPSIMVLKDDGAVGVRAVEGDTVTFYPVQIVGNEPDGLWVRGLPEDAVVITTGQSFVREGDKVKLAFVDEGAAS
jgi:membrane fusion protein, multidrug efflux system